MQPTSSRENLVKPIVVLTLICVVVSAMLAAVHVITAPIIEQQQEAAMQATLRELMPQAVGFTEIECALPRVVHVYRDEGGMGYAIVTLGHGYHGDLSVTTVIDNTGSVVNIAVDASGETAGVGTRVALSDYTDRFCGIASVEQVEVLSGATYSSKGVREAVELALEAYTLVTKEAG